MRPEDLLVWLRASPFRPFRVVMNSGTTFEVRHPELVRLLRTSFMYFTPAGDNPLIADRADMVGLVLIERVEPMDVPAGSAKGNGER